MTFGTSASPTASDYSQQVRQLGIQSVFVYQPGPASWSELCRAIDVRHDIWLSVSTTDVDALIRDLPEDRSGSVYLHYRQEPHDDISYEEWAAGSLTIFEKAAGHPAIVPAAEFSAYAFLSKPGGRWFLEEVQCYGFSSFADTRAVDGHLIALTDPVEQVNALADWAASIDRPWSVAACGFPIAVTHHADRQSYENRLAWTRAHISAARERQALHYQWFNILWKEEDPVQDYRIEIDPELLELWTAERLPANSSH
jgi:hypothetical protein